MSMDNLMNLLDSLCETSIYVIEEKSHRLLYFNRRCRETGRGRAVLGAKCHEIWPELCGNCPLEAMGDSSSSHTVCYDPLLKTTVDVRADRINWDGRIPAVVVTSSPHRPNFEEKIYRSRDAMLRLFGEENQRAPYSCYDCRCLCGGY